MTPKTLGQDLYELLNPQEPRACINPARWSDLDEDTHAHYEKSAKAFLCQEKPEQAATPSSASLPNFQGYAEVPINIELGEHGLYYGTSPAIKGLLVTGNNVKQVMEKVASAIAEMRAAEGRPAKDRSPSATRRSSLSGGQIATLAGWLARAWRPLDG